MPKVVLKQGKKKREHHPEAKGILFIACSLFIFFSLFSFALGHREVNWLGSVGYLVAYSLHYVFGLSSYFIVSFLMWIGWRLLKVRTYNGVGVKGLYFALFLFSMCTLLNVASETKIINLSPFIDKVYSQTAVIHAPIPIRYVRHNLGGVPFYYVYRDLPYLSFQNLLGDFGVFLSFSILLIVSFILLTDLSLFRSIKKAGLIFPLSYQFAIFCLKKTIRFIDRFLPEKPIKPEVVTAIPSPRPIYQKPPRTAPYQKGPREKVIFDDLAEDEPEVKPKESLALTMKPATVSKMAAKDFVEKITLSRQKGKRPYEMPPLNLLSEAKKADQSGLKKDLKVKADILEETLLSFGIEAKVGHIYSGPTITSFEVHPAIGVKVQRIKALENDIALNLQAKSIRIIAPIPGKAAVGVEIPSLVPQEVGFKEMLTNYQKGSGKYHIPMLLGKTVSGEEVICDLTRMPHCIIAGATGSGKSVCINTIIMSILMNLSPEDVRLILIDPKKVELTPFMGLPHLVAPVITEPSGAYAALQWIVKEMQTRYEILKRLGVRNINAFNTRKIDKEIEEALGIEIPERMYFIVCIIDEFADLMMTSSADLETPIARIAQMARAVGIHLILATQRPSREVITGLIKANFPTRISFKVSSRINSQIILDENGAEALLGNGDMLFLPPGTSQLIRCQGVFVRDEDINRTVEHIIRRIPTHYLFESFDAYAENELLASNNDTEPSDPLYEKALQLVLDTRTASTTFLQRKLKVGYARAASLMDMLEQNGVISSQDGAKSRRILRDNFED